MRGVEDWLLAEGSSGRRTSCFGHTPFGLRLLLCHVPCPLPAPLSQAQTRRFSGRIPTGALLHRLVMSLSTSAPRSGTVQPDRGRGWARKGGDSDEKRCIILGSE